MARSRGWAILEDFALKTIELDKEGTANTTTNKSVGGRPFQMSKLSEAQPDNFPWMHPFGHGIRLLPG